MYWSMFSSSNVTCNDTINVNNTIYTMTANSSINGSTCFTINGKNITIDCNGYTIQGNNTANTQGVFAQTGTSNITVKNCIIKNFSNALYFNTVPNITITNVTLLPNAVSGIITAINLASASNVYISNSNLTGGAGGGILAQTS